MEFRDALSFLDGHVNLEATAGRIHGLSLEAIRGLVGSMGDPQADLAAIHVTGTNGKGSVVAMAGALLTATGLRVGSYTSPHVDTIRERIKISGELISEEEFADVLNGVRDELSGVGEDRWVLVGGARPGWRGLDHVLAEASEGEPPEAAIVGGDMYNIIFSSGTTGEPKGIVHTHDVRSAYCTILSTAFRMTPESVVLHAGSIIFNGAFLTMMPAMHVGAKFVLRRHFDVEDYIAAVEREGVTHVALVPSQIVALLDSPNFNERRLGSLEMLCNVGAPVLKAHKERVAELLPGRFHDLYGQAEGFIGILDKFDYPAKPLSVGVPVPFYEMRIADDDGNEAATGEVGEICGRGPFVMPGYVQAPGPHSECPQGRLGCTPATSATWTATATCTWSTARRTC